MEEEEFRLLGFRLIVCHHYILKRPKAPVVWWISTP